MHETLTNRNTGGGQAIVTRVSGPLRIPVAALGMALGNFLALTFVLCVLFDLWLPDFSMHAVWAPLLPGFTWIGWGSFTLGLIESFAYGWYVALILGPMFNFFAAWSGDRR